VRILPACQPALLAQRFGIVQQPQIAQGGQLHGLAAPAASA
jgi:hypothetical protein